MTITIPKTVQINEWVDFDVEVEIQDFSDDELINELERRGYSVVAEEMPPLVIPRGVTDPAEYIAKFNELNNLA